MLRYSIYTVQQHVSHGGPAPSELALDKYVIQGSVVSLHVKGVVKYKYGGQELQNPCPFMALHAPGTYVELTREGERESWAVEIETVDVRPSNSVGMVEIRTEEHWLRTVNLIKLTRGRSEMLRNEFRKMRNWFHSPLPRNRLLVDLWLMNLLSQFISINTEPETQSPADRLKELIESDETMKKTLASLSHECGVSTDYLRDIFREKFGTNPHTYRNNVRMVRARELIERSSLSVKKISLLLGFRYVSHFSIMFRKYFGLPPSRAIKAIRQKLLKNEI